MIYSKFTNRADLISALPLPGGAELAVRLAGSYDEALLLEWANDTLTRRNAFNPQQIHADEHHAWFSRRLASPEWCLIYIVAIAGKAEIGQVRFEKMRDGDWHIDYALAPEFRGRRLAAAALRAAIAEFSRTKGRERLVATVFRRNDVSCRVFRSLGFSQNEGEAETVKYTAWTGEAAEQK